MQLVIGIFLGILIAFSAWRLGSLSRSGAVAAAITGSFILGLGGLIWAVPLLTFFISSSLLSHTFRSRKLVFDEKFSKGSRRDSGQVLANGGMGVLLVIAASLWPHPLWYIAYLGVMATVNGDTWATEIGVLSRSAPRLITTGKIVPGGTSGGVSVLGTLAALGGATTIGLAAFLSGGNLGWGYAGVFILAPGISGLLGTMLDSLLGATLQAIYYCPTCKKETERHPLHLCGTQTTPLRGWQWLNNDWVNFGSSLVGGGIAACLWLLVGK